ncbi:uncharacterized protein Dvar_51100 [Desulfosarcina variabilis str. Montpellier]|uniref:Eco57I restriction-modification methylase domain-containing protein n=1 Tax=Desulfosarcina variabilis TaxID=2300 RepID=UPI003AFA46B9
MNNNGLFSSLFIEELKGIIELDDAAQGRMATLAQTWRSRNSQDTESLWESFLKQALSYLEFVPPGNPTTPGVYPLFEDWGFKDCIGVLYLAPPDSDIDNITVGSFYPAKLLAQLKERKLNWGILTNGAIWRLYSTKSSRPYEDYVELRLEQALEGSDEAEYGLFERFFHKYSFIVEDVDDSEAREQDESVGVYKCRLDRDREQSEQVLEDSVKTPFLAQVDEVLQYICNGFIFDTQKSGEEYTEEERAEIFESAVKLIYRCLFLFYAEARRLLPSDPEKADLYQRHSIQTLCKEARKFRWGERRDTDHYDLWKHLKGLINAVNDGDPEYGIMGYNGGLFDDEEERFLGQHQLRNDFMCRALYLLAFVEPYNNEPDGEYAIPYEDLEVRHLGELYENILEYTVMLADADRIRRRTKKGMEMLLASQTTRKQGDTLIKKGDVYFGESALERKQTGSYYTPESLVRFLNEKTIVQPLNKKFEQDYRNRFDELLEQARKGQDVGTRRGAAMAASALVERFVEDEVLEFKVCDPAMGSGHFLVDVANQMAGLVVALLEEVPHVEGMRVSVTSQPNDWRRRITRHCIYGVDLNPLAVNLAKLSLWLNCFAIEHKLTFLDHHVRCGNSLIGIRSLDQLAYIPERKKEGNKKKDPQRLLFDYNDLSSALTEAGQGIASITQIDEDDTDSQKAVLYEALDATSHLRPLADLCTAYLMDPEIQPDEYKEIFERLAKGMSVADTLNPKLSKILDTVRAYLEWHHFYHWPLEFPDVFRPNSDDIPRSGFQAIVGNPPWDKIKPNSKEFFSRYDPQFRSYKKQLAKRVSDRFLKENPSIALKWEQYCSGFKQQVTFSKEPASYKSLGGGDVDLFKLFLEQALTLSTKTGFIGIIIPASFYANKGCIPLRQRLFTKNRVRFVYSFENRWPTIFTAVDGRKRIIVLSIEKGGSTDTFNCAFMQHDPQRLPSVHSHSLQITLKQVKELGRDSYALMEFQSQEDIDLTSKIYGDHPLLGDEIEGRWSVQFRSELHMTNHSSIFKNTETKWPLYEGKMIWHFDDFYEAPRYWVDADVASETIGKNAWETKCYRVGYRDIAAGTNERTLISTILPPAFHGNKIPTVSPYHADFNLHGPNNVEALWLTSMFCSYLMDYLIRQKVMETLNYFFLYSLPLLRLNQQETGSLGVIFRAVTARAARLICVEERHADLWENVFQDEWNDPNFWYPKDCNYIYGPKHEQETRKQLAESAVKLSRKWKPHFGLNDHLPDRRDDKQRAQFRAEIDAYISHLYGLTKLDSSYLMKTFPVLKRKEEAAFGEFLSERKLLEEYDRIGILFG